MLNLVTIATGRYDIFLPQLVKSARQFLPELNKIFVLSDVKPPDELAIEWLPWGHFQWPLTTLMRYQAMSVYSECSELFDCEVILYTDVDMLFVGEVNIPDITGLISVEHPGFVGTSPESLPLEKNPKSTFFVNPTKGQRYFAGGFQGGCAKSYLNACHSLANAINEELFSGRIPVWHDESAWNFYLTKNQPALVLSRNYCTPEKEANAESRVLALDKDHDVLRNVPKIKRKFRFLNLW